METLRTPEDRFADLPEFVLPARYGSGCALAFDALNPHEVTLVGQDWVGLIGLRLVAEHPGRFPGKAGDAGAPVCAQRLTQA